MANRKIHTTQTLTKQQNDAIISIKVKHLAVPNSFDGLKKFTLH